MITKPHEIEATTCLTLTVGGTRYEVASMRRWFERLFRLSPNLSFQVHSVASGGWPWNTAAVVEWTDAATPIDGKSYVNFGAHVIRMRCGKIVRLHAYLDTKILSETLARLAAAGFPEAAAVLIT